MITIKTEDGYTVEVSEDLYNEIGSVYFDTNATAEQVVEVSGLDIDSESDWDLFWDIVEAYRVEHELESI